MGYNAIGASMPDPDELATITARGLPDGEPKEANGSPRISHWDGISLFNGSGVPVA